MDAAVTNTGLEAALAAPEPFVGLRRNFYQPVGAARSGSSGFKGVTAHQTRWRARIVVGGKRLILGTWGDPKAAALAYDEAALRYFGDFAFLNFPHTHGGARA